MSLFYVSHLTDARSKYWYPYNWSQISQYVKYAKWIKIAKMHHFVTKNVFDKKSKNTTKTKLKSKMCLGLFTQKSKNTTTTKHTIKHPNPCQSRKTSPGVLAPQSDALPLNHQVNCKYRLLSTYLTVSVSTQCVQTSINKAELLRMERY